MADATSRGRFVWYDLMTTDPTRAQEFYTKVMQWGTQTWENPMPYTMFTAGETPIGGIMELPAGPGAPPHWVAYIATPNADKTAADGEAHGGKTLVKPKDIPTVGRYGVFSDPQGATYAGFTPAPSSQERPTGPPSVGQFSWHELATTDFDGAFRFYETLFGWQKLADHDMGPMGVYRIFGIGGTQLGGMFNKPPSLQAPPHWLYYVMVESTASAVERVKANGGQVLNGPMEVPGGDWIAQCLDPQGGAFAVQSKGK